jgi:hypothetical protein
MSETKNVARRYSEGKIRHELIPINSIHDIATVYTNGAHKYTIYEDAKGKEYSGLDITIEDVSKLKLRVKSDGANNWRNGLSWMKTIGAVKRHIGKWEMGEDIDPDPKMKTKHLANAAWGLITILDYYKTNPEFDDRHHGYLHRKKIGLDIDEVICDWISAWRKKFGYDIPDHWNFSYKNSEHFKSMTEEEMNEFYLNIPPKIDPKTLPFEPHVYITSRSVPTELTKAWIQKHGFPTVPVYSVGFEKSKVEVAKESGIEWFVDDRYENFVELNKAGICTFLLDAPHNRKYDVGYKRIGSLNDLV